jgi:tetratricopeptide (TPR) repeat protein/predicted Ser/Thr protein kinase
VGYGLRKLGKYELLGELGRGAFGVVYRARDPIINRMVALKTMTTGVAGNASLLARFYREAQSAAYLQHPNIVTIYEMADEDGTPFIAMELVDGENLDQLIAKHAELPLPVKLLYALQACRAFDYAHKRGIVHRDIKPGNVMVNKEGTVKVVDFGIARILEASKTQTGTLIGTFSYMAPEVFHGEHATERADIWSFGVLLYEFLAYKQPFTGESAAALMQSICLQEPLPLRQVAPDCPQDLESLVHRMLRKSEAERFQTMEDLLLELDPICRRLQAETVAALVEQVRQLTQQGELSRARDRVREALQVDATNLELRALAEKVNAELKRLAVRNQAQRHVEEGRRLLKEGKPQEAGEQADHALRLDSQFQPARVLQQETEQEINRLHLAQQYLESARQRFVEGMPEEAEALLLKVEEVDPSNPQLPALQRQVLQEKERRQKRVQLREGMQQARGLWIQRKYSECLDVLAQLQQSFPAEDDILRLLETAREDQAEQNKQEKLAQARELLVVRRYDECIALLENLLQEFPREDEVQRVLETARADQAEYHKREKLAEARKLLSARSYEQCLTVLAHLQQDLPHDEEIGRLLESARRDQAEHDRKERLAAARALLAEQRFADALALLDSLLASDPKDSAVLKLRTVAQREQETQVQSAALQREWEALKKLVSERAYAEAAARAESLLLQFPGNADLVRLLEFAREQQAHMEKDLRLRSARDQVQELLQAGRFAEAAAAAGAGLESFPGNAELTSLLKRAQAGEKKEMVRQLIERRIREIKVRINRGQLSEAKELAQETLKTLGADTDVNQLLSSAEVEYEAREKKKRQEQTLETIRVQVRSRHLTEATAALDGLIQSGNFDALDPRLYQVAEEIAAAREAAAATTASVVATNPESPAGEYAILEGPPLPPAESSSQPATQQAPAAPQPVMQQAPTAPQPTIQQAPATPQPAPSIAQPVVSTDRRAELTPAALGQAARLLAPHVGPIAGVLAKRAAQRADSLRSLYLLLAEYVENQTHRARFLRDAGFPDS